MRATMRVRTGRFPIRALFGEKEERSAAERRVFSLCACSSWRGRGGGLFAAAREDRPWWHIGTAANDKPVLPERGPTQYMKLHPDVTIEITVLENEAFKSKPSTVMQSGQPARPLPELGRRGHGTVRGRPASCGTSPRKF